MRSIESGRRANSARYPPVQATAACRTRSTRLIRGLTVAMALVCLPLTLLPHTVQAADFIFLEDECNGRQLMISGPIAPGDAGRFADHLWRMTGGDLPAVQNTETLWTLKLDSEGGDLAEAMAIGRLVRQTLITTEVSYRYARRLDGVYDIAQTSKTLCIDGGDRLAGCAPGVAVADCTGACLLIWIAGVDRRAIEGRLGRHGLAADRAAITGYLGEMEVDAEQIEHLLETGNGTAADAAIPETAQDDGWLSWSDRDALAGRAPSLVALLEACPAPLTEAEVIESVMTDVPGRRDTLLDRADAYWKCRNARVEQSRAAIIATLTGSRLSAD